MGILLLASRLFELQIIKGGYFRSLSEGNRVKRITLPAPRGKILARGGEILVDNKPVEKRQEEEVVTEWLRFYKMGEAFAHVSGYLGQINEKELDKIDPKCPEKGPRKSGDLVGRGGLEEEYDCVLRGIDGEELVEVDTLGRRVRVLGKKEPQAGSDLKTTVDFSLQEEIARIYPKDKGGVIVTDISGQILALYSSPSFDPNIFVNPGNETKVDNLFRDKDLPLFDRVIGGKYHPGSIFKPLVATAALEEAAIENNFVFNDPGVITVNEFSYANWLFTQYGGKEGEIGVERAIARSTDTFFYKIGELTGIDKLVLWTKKFELDKLTGIDIPGEVSGLVPSPSWKKKVKGEAWFLGNTYHFSIGQGDLALTVVGVNRYISAISYGGKLCKPFFVSDGWKGDCKYLGISRKSLESIRDGMIAACSPKGTGITFFDFSPQVACKTGTAETNEDGKTHAWFVVFGPAHEPDIVATVLVEGGGEGSKVAGPIARQIFDYWFKRKELIENP